LGLVHFGNGKGGDVTEKKTVKKTKGKQQRHGKKGEKKGPS